MHKVPWPLRAKFDVPQKYGLARMYSLTLRSIYVPRAAADSPFKFHLIIFSLQGSEPQNPYTRQRNPRGLVHILRSLLPNAIIPITHITKRPPNNTFDNFQHTRIHPATPDDHILSRKRSQPSGRLSCCILFVFIDKAESERSCD